MPAHASHRLKGRLAPSPSGRMHLGNLLSFMVAWIDLHQAASRQGREPWLVLRMEDLDPDRSKPQFAFQLLKDLELLGFEWETPVMHQSDRTEAYARAFQTLESLGLVYPCFCTRADLAAVRAPHPGEEAVYPGTCRNLPAGSREGRRCSWRLRTPDAEMKVQAFDDLFQGRQEFDLAKTCGDFIVRRSDGVHAYQLAVAVDDAFQEIDRVVRGYDLLASTPRQLYIQDLLGFDHPSYGHVPLVVNEEGRRLSKRDHDADLGRLLDERHESPAAILGKLAHAAGLVDQLQPATLAELAEASDLAALEGKRAITLRRLF